MYIYIYAHTYIDKCVTYIDVCHICAGPEPAGRSRARGPETSEAGVLGGDGDECMMFFFLIILLLVALDMNMYYGDDMGILLSLI